MPSCKKNNAIADPRPAEALYLHVPFCRAKCRYCDFYSLANESGLIESYIASAHCELQMRGDCIKKPPASIFVGGGTPTALGAAALGRLLSALAPMAGGDTEFSVEANPATVDQAVADVLAKAGVNRISIGAQSFSDAELATLGRIHKPHDVAAAVGLLRRAGIDNIGLDLIYGTPGQSMESWRSSLEQALSLNPSHLSCYALSFEEGTPLADDLTAGKTAEMDEQLQYECYLAAIEAAAQAGLEHYEISNFASPGRQCRHNLTYWRNEPYLGIGPAAASHIGGERRTNSPDIQAYIAALSAGRRPPGKSEKLTGRAEMAETLMLGLRLTHGVDIKAFTDRFGVPPAEAFPMSFSRYLAQSAIVANSTHIRLSENALFVANTVLSDILAEV